MRQPVDLAIEVSMDQREAAIAADLVDMIAYHLDGHARRSWTISLDGKTQRFNNEYDG